MIYSKLLITLSLILVVSACASARTDKAIAYSNFEDGDYADAIEWIRRAESRGDVTPETKAELTYLEAQSLEKMGEYDGSEELYSYLVEQHPKSKYGYLAKSKLEKEIE
ncbi:MAG: hypothetical protein AAFY56_10855 [Pseudomonadota bacterium]